MTIENIPADAQKCLETNQTKMSWFLMNGALDKIQVEIAGNGGPRFDTNATTEMGRPGRMSDGMTLIAQGCRFTSVIIVHGNQVSIDFILVAIEFQQTIDDMVHFDDMVTFEIFSSTTAQTTCGSIALYPFGIAFGKPQTCFYGFMNRSCSHTFTIPPKTGFSLTKHGIYAYVDIDPFYVTKQWLKGSWIWYRIADRKMLGSVYL